MLEQLPSFVSISLFIVSIYLFNRISPSKPYRLAFGILTFAYFGSFAAFIIANHFTGEGINEAVLYHIKYGVRGAGLQDYIDIIVAASAVLAIAVLLTIYVVTRRSSGDKKGLIWRRALLFLAILISISTHPLTRNAVLLFYAERDDSLDFYDYCRAGDLMEISDEKPNFVFIYLEGLERTYFDEDIFPGLIKGLKQIEENSYSFTDIEEVAGTGWTIAGMVASLCGLPLFTPSHSNSMSGMDLFLPNAICLGDLLHSKGYYLAYLGGAFSDFAGKGNFFKTHGFSEVLGRDALRLKLDDPRYMSGWGIYDDSLFDMAYDRFIELSQENRPFGLFMLTLDTHHPEGHMNRTTKDIAYGDGSNPMLNAVAGSDYLVSSFINKIRDSQYGSNTVIVVLSDHLAMHNTASDMLNKLKRKNLFIIISPIIETRVEIDARGSMLDVASTVLPFLGYRGDLGLGRDLVAKKSLNEQLDGISKHLNAWRDDVISLWRFPKLKKGISINPEDRTIMVDNRTLKYPLLIELNKNMDVDSVKFEFYSTRHDKLLKDHIKSIVADNSFIWVDSCEKMREYHISAEAHSTCLMIGKMKESEHGLEPIGEVIPFTDSISIEKIKIEEILAK